MNTGSTITIDILPREQPEFLGKYSSFAKQMSIEKLAGHFVPSARCFSDVMDFALNHGNRNHKFVHGLLRLPDGYLSAHGWIEIGPKFVIEGKFYQGILYFVKTPASAFIERHTIVRQQKYTRSEIIKHFNTNNNDCGPWVPWLQDFCAESEGDNWFRKWEDIDNA